MTAENIENVCMIQINEGKDPVVASFLKTVMEKIEVTSGSNSLSKDEVTSANTVNYHGKVPELKVGCKGRFSHHLKQAR